MKKRQEGLLRQSSSLQLVPIWKLQAGAVLKCRLQGGQLPSCLWLYQCWHLTLAAVLELTLRWRRGERLTYFHFALGHFQQRLCLNDIWKEEMKSKSALHGGCWNGAKNPWHGCPCTYFSLYTKCPLLSILMPVTKDSVQEVNHIRWNLLGDIDGIVLNSQNPKVLSDDVSVFSSVTVCHLYIST